MRDETELEAVRRARDSVLANISHEFRTPLAAQLASIELLRDGLDAHAARATRASWSQSLQRGTLRLTRLIDNLLESVRIESGQLGIRRQPVSLARGGRGCRGPDRRACWRSAARCCDVDDPGRPAACHGRRAAPDAGVRQPARQREQVRARGQRGRASARRARARHGRALGRGRRARARRSSSGSSIFERFYRAADRRAGAARHRPRPVDREVDRRAPRRRGRARRAPARARRASPCALPIAAAGRMKILVVDDDPDLLALVAFALTQAGYRRGQGRGRGGGAARLRRRAAGPRDPRHQPAGRQRLRRLRGDPRAVARCRS